MKLENFKKAIEFWIEMEEKEMDNELEIEMKEILKELRSSFSYLFVI